jgi:hypothetical protein
MRSDEQRVSPRLQGDRGAALLEGAVVALPFFILMFGMLEYGLVFKSYLSLASATNSSGRAASTFGNAGNSDYLILRTINEGAGGMDREAIHTIVIWHATGPDDSPPAACLDGDGSVGTGAPAYVGACNVYDYTDFEWDEADFDCDPLTAGPVDYDWCATDRKDWLSDTDATGPLKRGTDFIGVYVEADYDMLTGMFGSQLSLSETSITRIDAQGLNA